MKTTCPWTTGGDDNGLGAARCGRPTTHRCDYAPDTCARHKSSCCVPKDGGNQPAKQVVTEFPVERGLARDQEPATITGYFMPTRAPSVGEEVGDPVLIGMSGMKDLFVFVFSTEEKLVAAMEVLGIQYASVASVVDGADLIGEVVEMNANSDGSYRIRVIIDAHKTDDGRVHFLEPSLRKVS